MSLGSLVVPLGDAKEARWWAVAAPTFVSVATWAIEVIKSILVGTPTLAAYYQIFVVATVFDCVAQAEAVGAL